MDWTTLVATLLGAAIATITTLLAESHRDRRHMSIEWLRTRRDLYAAFLAALAKARDRLAALSKDRRKMKPWELEEAARQAFAPCYELRHQFELIVGDDALEPAIDYFRRVRDLRTVVAKGLGPGSEEWDRCMELVKEALKKANQEMRADLAPKWDQRGRLEGRKGDGRGRAA